MTCPTCLGKGQIVLEEPLYFEDGYYLLGEFECTDCHSDGEIFDDTFFI